MVFEALQLNNQLGPLGLHLSPPVFDLLDKILLGTLIVVIVIAGYFEGPNQSLPASVEIADRLLQGRDAFASGLLGQHVEVTLSRQE